jgi:soluble lytic murein transglycosylase
MRLSAVFLVILLFALPVYANGIVQRAFDSADKKDWPLAIQAAQQSQNPLLVAYVKWRMLRSDDIRASGVEYLAFLEQYPLWPDKTLIFRRGGEALLLNGFTQADLARWRSLYLNIYHHEPTPANDLQQALIAHTLKQGALNNWEKQQLQILYGVTVLSSDVARRRADWMQRKIDARDAIEAGQYQRALALLNQHGQTDGIDLADALWLRGWLQYEFLNNPGEAYKDFYQLYEHVGYPVSLARGAYWAGRAAKRNNNPDIAQRWFQQAANHPTTFYGQLALIELPGSAILRVPDQSKPSTQARFTQQEQDMINLIEVLARYQQNYSVEVFLKALAAHQGKRAENWQWLGEFAQRLGYPHYSVRLAKLANQEEHIFLADISHPMRQPPNAALEPALALAITRQESEFDPRARSSADAMGMMQLLPGTAKLVARRYGISYDYSRLYDPDYNMTLGSYYLSDLIEGFDGNYVLAIAGYNAGPSNVRRWISRFGKPNMHSIDDTLRWMELIPFAETRNYVHRVLENTQIYRARLGQAVPMSAATLWQRPGKPLP